MAEPQWAAALKAAHCAVAGDCCVVHASRLPSSSRYFVWQEDGGNDFRADDRREVGALRGATDLFTNLELDPWAEALEEALDDHGIAWTYTGCTYEGNTGLWHHTWDWEVLR